MIELSPAEFPLAAPLFTDISHNAALVFSVLEGNSPGRVFVDAAHQPSWAYVSVDGAFSYLGGYPSAGSESEPLAALIFDALLPVTVEKELVLFVFSGQGRAWMELAMRRRGAIEIERKIFDFNPARFQRMPGWQSRIPRGMDLRPIDARIAALNPQFLPLVEQPASKRFGVCLFANGEITSACSAVAVGRNEAEIDIFTAETHRGKGLATITACAFIEECLLRGLRPAWSCWPYREGSYALARKLGFEERPDAPAFYWAEAM